MERETQENWLMVAGADLRLFGRPDGCSEITIELTALRISLRIHHHGCCLSRPFGGRCGLQHPNSMRDAARNVSHANSSVAATMNQVFNLN